ncbi:MAG: 4'-phosphopantetheinyl transferase superfamily protein [Spirochaetaceae bacterium]|nr:4'-phosphopantetheinyl transferase superfamily protein [Spirochaetaceae bacterium]
MVQNNLIELWLGFSEEINQQMLSGKTNDHSIRDYFLETILQKYIKNFSLRDLEKNEHGKPSVRTGDISFNLSHCDEFYALLLCDQDFCGIDIQQVKSRMEYEEAFQSIFTDREMAILNQIDLEAEFFRMWSVKEAYIKAMGSSIWFGRDYDFSTILPYYTDRWISVNNLFLYSTEVFPGVYLSAVLPEKPCPLRIKKF